MALFPSGVLAFAAVGKLSGAYASLYLIRLTFSEVVFNVMLPVMELLIAIGLVFFLSRSVFLAGVAFALYVGYLIQVRVTGGSTCNCLGGSIQDVRVVMAIDFICLGLLLISSPFRLERQSYLLPCSIVFFIPSSALFLIFNPGVSSLIAMSFVPGPLRSDFRPGNRVVSNSNHASEVKITNRSRRKLQLKRILASCDCTKLSPSSLVLEPGESKTLQIAIDLNKSYAPGQSSQPHHITASCYDDKDDLVDNITLFKGSSFRTFAVDTRRRNHEWREGASNTVEIPIEWLSKSDSPVDCMVNGMKVATAFFPQPLILNVERPKAYFEIRHLVLCRSENADQMVLESDLSVIAKPDDVTVNFRIDERSHEIAVTDSLEFVEARICNMYGEVIHNLEVRGADRMPDGGFSLSETTGKGGCYFDLAVTEQNKPSHRIVIPFYSPGAHP